jgi:hypothetical protein
LKSIAESGRRLSYDDGQWSLETSELIRLDRNLYRPERRRIDGSDAILAHLRSRGEGNLLSAAERLVRVSDVDGTTYEAQNGEWIEAEPSLSPSEPSHAEQLADEVTALRSEVVLLRAAYSGLAARLQKFERWMSDGPGTSGRVREIRPNGIPASIDERGAPAVASQSAEEAARGSSIRLPEPSAVLACVQRVIGDSLVLEITNEKLPTELEALCRLDAAILLDGQGRERAVVLSNLRATVECGGALLGIPSESIEEQILSGVAEPDLVLGMNEVVKNLSDMIGREPQNPELRPEALVKTPVERLPWLTAPGVLQSFAIQGGGRLWLAAR